MHRVALAVPEHTMLLELALAVEVFGTDRGGLSPSGQWYALTVCTPDGAPARWLPDAATRGFSALPDADTVIIPSTSAPECPPDPDLLSALCTAHDRGARIVSLC